MTAKGWLVATMPFGVETISRVLPIMNRRVPPSWADRETRTKEVTANVAINRFQDSNPCMDTSLMMGVGKQQRAQDSLPNNCIASLRGFAG